METRGISERIKNLPYGQEILDRGFLKTNVFGVYFKALPKVGSSTLTQILLELLYPGITKIDHKVFNRYQNSSIDDWLHISSPDLLQVQLGDELLSNAHLFTFCRNPYARLLSYYRNKFNGFLADDEWEFIKHLRRQIVYHAARERGVALESVLDDKYGVTFDAFVRYICAESTPSDIHWRPQIWVTGAPVIPYKKIIRAETLNLELTEVFRDFCYIEIPLINKLKASSPIDLSVFYNEKLAELVYTFYKKDFEFFDYDEDSWT